MVAPVLIGLIALSNLSGGRWPIEAYSTRWWEAVGFAVFTVVLGAWRRRNADDALDAIDELAAAGEAGR